MILLVARFERNRKFAGLVRESVRGREREEDGRALFSSRLLSSDRLEASHGQRTLPYSFVCCNLFSIKLVADVPQPRSHALHASGRVGRGREL